MPLDLQHATGNKEKLLFPRFLLHSDLARLKACQQWGMLWRNADFAHLGRRKHHGAFSGPYILFGTDDINSDGIGHMQVPLIR